MADARKSLDALRAEWLNCTACDLGRRRKAVEGAFVFGEGKTGGIMFIGEGPGKDEETHGRPFIGEAGDILRRVLQRLNFSDCYLTSLVTCRACTPATDSGGQPIFRKDYASGKMLPLMRDEPPVPLQVGACLPRLHEEIYLVDPVLIVAVGPVAAKTLIGRSVSITDPDVRGQPFQISIPGAGAVPNRTAIRGAWLRKAGGKLVMPTEQATVRYLCIPTIHPSRALSRKGDQSIDSPLMLFARDVQKAVQVYERYRFELQGIVPSGAADREMDFPIEEYETEGD